MTVPYLTEERFRVLGFTGDLGELSSAEIRNLLIAASAKVDAYCAVPKMPQPYSFRGGTVTDEIHDWFPGDALTPAQRRIWAFSKPIKAVSALKIYVTINQFTEFDPTELMIQRTIGAIDLVSLGLTTSAPLGAYVLPNIGLQHPQVAISYTYGWQLTATDEILEPTDAFYFRAVNQFWDDTDVVVKVDGVVQSTGFTLDKTEGAVVFDAAQSPEAVVTCSYGYTLPQDIATATGLIAHDMFNERELDDKGMGNVRSLKVGEISIDRGLRYQASGSNQDAVQISPDAEGYLAGYRFITVR